LSQIKAGGTDCTIVGPDDQVEESMPQPAKPTGYACIAVAMDPEPDTENRVRIAAALSDTFDARLIGIAAHPIAVPLYFETPVPGIASAVELAERQAGRELAATEALFRRACGARSRVEWRQSLAYPSDYVPEQARAADLVIAGLPRRSGAVPHPMTIDAGDLVMAAGRPVLFVPGGTERLRAKRIVVAWKDTREARRAIVDALPLLRQASKVVVASFGSDENGAKDVCAYLGHHGVKASPVQKPEAPGAAAEGLLTLVDEQEADLIVCGAYGHSRAREWAFGGVTRDLLNRSRVCCLMSH
jgi:nucleotide-binding universal stress UspA family protein